MPPSLSLCSTHSSLLTHPPILLSSLSSFLLHPPSLGKQGQQISLLFSARSGEEDTWTTLRVSALSSHGPLLPLPLSASEEAVIVPAPVSEEIGKSDGFVSRPHGDKEKRVGPARRERGEKTEWVREEVLTMAEQSHHFGFATQQRHCDSRSLSVCVRMCADTMQKFSLSFIPVVETGHVLHTGASVHTKY